MSEVKTNFADKITFEVGTAFLINSFPPACKSLSEMKYI